GAIRDAREFVRKRCKPLDKCTHIQYTRPRCHKAPPRSLTSQSSRSRCRHRGRADALSVRATFTNFSRRPRDSHLSPLSGFVFSFRRWGEKVPAHPPKSPPFSCEKALFCTANSVFANCGQFRRPCGPLTYVESRKTP